MQKALLSGLCLVFALISHSQHRESYLGIKLINDLTLNHGWSGSGGLQFIQKSVHHGFETGLYYSKRKDYYGLEKDKAAFSFIEGVEHRLQIPLFYRYESRIFNLSGGPCLDILMAWDKTRFGNTSELESNRKSLRMMYSLGLSRTLSLGHSLYLEPEFRGNYTFREKNGGAALNIGLKKLI